MRRTVAGVVLTVGLMGIARASMPPPEQMLAPTSVVTLPKEGATVPMNSDGGRPIIEVRINGSGPYRFMLDTGATMTLLDPEVARALSLSPATTQSAAAAAMDRAPMMVKARELRIGAATVTNCNLAVMPMRMSRGADGPAGILSASSFPGYLLTLNYRDKTVALVRGSLPAADEKSVFQYTETEVLPTVPVLIGGYRTRVHLDTGSPFGLTLPMKFLSELPLEAPPVTGRPVRTPSGEFPVSIGKVRGEIRVGAIPLDLSEVFFSDARPSPAPAVGNIGFKVLDRWVVTLDSKSRRIELHGA
jgi:hypothetical protein